MHLLLLAFSLNTLPFFVVIVVIVVAVELHRAMMPCTLQLLLTILVFLSTGPLTGVFVSAVVPFSEQEKRQRHRAAVRPQHSFHGRVLAPDNVVPAIVEGPGGAGAGGVIEVSAKSRFFACCHLLSIFDLKLRMNRGNSSSDFNSLITYLGRNPFSSLPAHCGNNIFTNAFPRNCRDIPLYSRFQTTFQ